MKLPFLLILCHLSLPIFCQSLVESSWGIECGASTNNALESPSLNLRYLSPRFKWSNEEDPGKFKKNARLMFELIYTPPFKVLCTGLNVQYRFLNYKRLNLDIYGGYKFFFIPGPNFENIPYHRKGKKYIGNINIGLLCQFDLGIISPFIDMGIDSIITIGTQVNFRAIYRKPKKRYELSK